MRAVPVLGASLVNALYGIELDFWTMSICISIATAALLTHVWHIIDAILNALERSVCGTEITEHKVLGVRSPRQQRVARRKD